MNETVENINNERSLSDVILSYSSKIISGADLHKAYSLRHKVYAEELGWVKQSPSKLEVDNYEKDSVTFGVLSDTQQLLATLRLIPHQCKYMLEEDFSNLVSSDYKIIKSPATAEITRLCIDKDFRNIYCEYPFGKSTFSLLLYKALYQYSVENKIQYLYMVVEYKILRLLCLLGFPCKKIGDPVKMPDGVRAVAAVLDWREFERISVSNKPAMLKWFVSNSDKDHNSIKPLDSATAIA